MSLKLFLASFLGVILSLSCRGQWISQPSPTSYAINEIHFLTENLGFLGTSTGVYKTIDGGKNWTSPQYPVAFDAQLLKAGYIYDIYFFDNNRGLIAGSGFHNAYDVIAKTSDGGATWQIVYYQGFSNAVSRPTLSGITFLNDQVGFCVGGNGKILKTENGGESWSAITSPVTSNFTSIQFVSSTIGFIAGEKILLKTTDAGISWNAMPLEFRISDLHFFSTARGIATTLEGKILMTENGGATWSEHPIDFKAMLGRMAFQNETGYAVAFDALAHKYILKTTDGGKIWEQQNVSTTYSLAGIDVAPGGKVRAGSIMGNLFATTSGSDISYPIASFTPSHTAFCQNLNYSFKNNGPEGLYTYGWYIDGTLKSTDYNFSTTFTPGNHSIELRVSKGTLTSATTLNIGVELAVSFAQPLEIAYSDGICAGESTIVTVKNAQYGSYKLYDGNEVIATDTEYYPEVTLQTPVLQATKTFRVSATRSNSCQTVEITADALVTVHNDLRSGSTVQAAKEYFCNEGQPVFNITSSKKNVRYEVYQNNKVVASGIGNGNVLSLSSAIIRDTSVFSIKASAINGVCAKWFDNTIKINVEHVKADFYLSPPNVAAGEPVNIYNKSIGATDFQWTFPGAFVNSSVKPSPDPIAFIGAGNYNTTLRAVSATGCSHVATVAMNVYDDAPLQQCWANGVGVSTIITDSYGMRNYYSVAAAPDGDVLTTGIYIGQAEFDSKNGVQYITSEAIQARSYLARYSAKGVLKWIINTSVYEQVNRQIGSTVKLAADGSIMVLTCTGRDIPEFYSANGDTIQGDESFYSYQHLIKYTADGMVEWFRPVATDSDVLTDFEIDDAGNSYIVTSNGNLYRWSSSGEYIDVVSVTYLRNFELVVAPDGSFYTIHATGENSLSIKKYTSAAQLEWNKFVRGTSDYKYYGKATISTDNDLIFFGRARGNMTFDSEGEDEKVVNAGGFFLVRYDASGKVEWVNTATEHDGVLRATGIASNTFGYSTVMFEASGLEPVVVQSQDGNHTTFNYKQKPYLVTYDTEGNIVATKALLDEYVMGTSVDMVSAHDNLYVIGNLSNEYRRTEQLNGDVSICFGNPATINGNTIYSEQEDVLYIAKLSDGCNWQYPIFEVNVEGLGSLNSYCAGASFDVSYSVNGGIPLGKDNVYRVLLYNPAENCRMEIGRLASDQPTGSIHAKIPDNLPSGSYKVSVLASNPKLYARLTNNINIRGSFDFDFTYTSTADLMLNFSATSADGIAYTWKIEGKEIQGMYTTYKFPNTGSFTVCLVVKDECNIERVICKDVIVTCAEVPTDFTYTVTEKTVTFKGITKADNTIRWDFGDGTSATELNTQHTYSSFGDKYVCLRSSTACNSGIACKTVKLSCSQGALAFSYSTVEKNVQFKNSSAAEYTAFIWSFGDGTTSTETSPSHLYTQPGNYTVTVKSTGVCGEQRTLSQTISITCVAPTPGFSATVSNLDVVFTNSSLDARQTLWNFGDGATSSAVAPQHRYSSAGSYWVCMTVSNNCTQKSICKQVTVNYTAPDAPLTFTASTLSTTSVALRWSDNATTEQSYSLEYKVASTSQYQSLATLAANTTQYIAGNLLCGTLYTFRIRAVGTGINNVSAWKEVTGGTSALPVPVIETVNSEIKSVTAGDTYQWYLNGLPLDGANQQTVVPETSGNYKVEVINDGCKSMSKEIAFVITGIEDNSSSEIDLYPVPAHDFLTIAFDESGHRNTGSINLINTSGSNVLTVAKRSGEETVELNIANLPAGLYICMITVPGKIIYRKLNIY
jgi:photosystem II stability/assembly factor-like uncharacterized protein/PKD repeat protein